MLLKDSSSAYLIQSCLNRWIQTFSFYKHLLVEFTKKLSNAMQPPLTRYMAHRTQPDSFSHDDVLGIWLPESGCYEHYRPFTCFSTLSLVVCMFFLFVCFVFCKALHKSWMVIDHAKKTLNKQPHQLLLYTKHFSGIYICIILYIYTQTGIF